MADFSYTSAPNGFRPIWSSNTGIIELWGVLSVACKAGDPLVWDAAGKLKPHTAASATERIVGVAQADGAINDEIPFVPADPTVTFEVEYSVATADVRAIVGTLREIVGTTGVFGVGSATTNGIVVVLGYAPDYAPATFGDTTTNGRILVRFAKSASTRLV